MQEKRQKGKWVNRVDFNQYESDRDEGDIWWTPIQEEKPKLPNTRQKDNLIDNKIDTRNFITSYLYKFTLEAKKLALTSNFE